MVSIIKSQRDLQRKKQQPASLHKSEIFDTLSTAEMQRLLGMVERLELPKHHQIFGPGTAPASVYFIESGSVRVTRPSPDGKSFVILSLLGPGDLLGDAAWESGDHDASAQTLEYSVLSAVPRESFENFVRENPAFALRLIQLIGTRLKQTQNRIEDLVFRQVPSRVAKLFINLSENHGKMTANGIILELPLTHQEIADIVGSSRVTVTQVLNRFRASNWVDIKKKRVIIHDMDALEELVASDANPKKRAKDPRSVLAALSDETGEAGELHNAH